MEAMKKSKLHLGCGSIILKDFINVDIVKMDGVDVCYDLNINPWPFEDNMFDYVYTSHCLEHVKNILGAIDELHRICKNGAIIHIIVPYFASEIAFRDLTHYNHFTLKTFNNWEITDEYRSNYNSLAKFKVIQKQIHFIGGNPNRKWHTFGKIVDKVVSIPINALGTIYERFLCFLIPCSVIEYKLSVIK